MRLRFRPYWGTPAIGWSFATPKKPAISDANDRGKGGGEGGRGWSDSSGMACCREGRADCLNFLRVPFLKQRKKKLGVAFGDERL